MKILEEALKRFEVAQGAEQELRELALEDFRFAAGEQWPDEIRKQRDQQNRPCLTFNRLPQFIRQVTGSARQNKPAVKVIPVDSGSDIELADIYNGLIRNIESQSRAEEAYMTALENAVTGGLGGGWRICTVYSSDDSFDQDIRIKRINNPFAIYWDNNAKEFDKSDAMWCFVSEWVSKEVFESKYPKETPQDWKEEYSRLHSSSRHWLNNDKVRMAEYWVKTPVKKTIGLLNGQTLEVKKGLETLPWEMTREVDSYKTERYLLSGHAVLEGPKEFPSKWIPIIPCFGPEEWIDDRVRYVSLIRYAKDPMRMYNFWQPLALDTPLPTPTGWTTMGAIGVGDELYDENGKPCRVIGKSLVYINRDCFEVCFDDGSKIVADSGHPWVVEERGKRKSATYEWTTKKVTTAELVAGKHFIQATKPLMGRTGELEVSPYVLGLWLGDGASAGGRISSGDQDAEETMQNIRSCGYEVSRNESRKGADIGVYGLLAQLRSAGVLNNKHIPEKYLRADEVSRLELLRGLMDSDGSISSGNRSSYFTNTNQRLAEGFSELLRTFGIKVKCVRRDGRKAVINGHETQGVDQWQFNFTTRLPVFKLSRKLAHIGVSDSHPRRYMRHGVVSVTKVPSVPVQCVGIDAPSHLFLAGEAMVPTHNSTIAEKIAMAPKSPWLVTPQMIQGLEQWWNKANVDNAPYLPYNPDPAGGRPQRQEPAYVNAAEIQQSAQAVDDLKATMGMYDASLGNQGNETSGRAIIARQREGDNATFAWIDNLARAIQHTGRILVDLIPKIYDTQRVVRILGEDGSQKMVEINTVIEDTMVNDLSIGKYDVEVTTGPSYRTRRIESAESWLALSQAMPQVGQVASDVVVRNLDLPGSDEVADRLKKALPPGMVDVDDPEEQQAMQQQQEEMQRKQAIAEKLQIETAIAEIAVKKSTAAKNMAEAEAQDIENDAVQTGLMELLGG